ncbi:hypothetical protein BCV70DRAFT_217188 [Testicularia cyperi]|uniref:Uncharacterized protein n=1 Tax=Testicularia cyperi TaxID=1882483 RepID=A0A317XQ16_9BASI|nr:hypothetical protein BCV70DRAFT_217188 [Testicularia cyperi]
MSTRLVHATLEDEYARTYTDVVQYFDLQPTAHDGAVLDSSLHQHMRMLQAIFTPARPPTLEEPFPPSIPVLLPEDVPVGPERQRVLANWMRLTVLLDDLGRWFKLAIPAYLSPANIKNQSQSALRAQRRQINHMVYSYLFPPNQGVSSAIATMTGHGLSFTHPRDTVWQLGHKFNSLIDLGLPLARNVAVALPSEVDTDTRDLRTFILSPAAAMGEQLHYAPMRRTFDSVREKLKYAVNHYLNPQGIGLQSQAALDAHRQILSYGIVWWGHDSGEYARHYQNQAGPYLTSGSRVPSNIVLSRSVDSDAQDLLNFLKSPAAAQGGRATYGQMQGTVNALYNKLLAAVRVQLHPSYISSQSLNALETHVGVYEDLLSAIDNDRQVSESLANSVRAPFWSTVNLMQVFNNLATNGRQLARG